MIIWRAGKQALQCMALLAVTGCTTHFLVRPAGHAVVQGLPSQGAVHPYPSTELKPPPERGPLVAIYVATTAELETLAPRKTHHLYFSLLPCAQQSRGPSLYGGSVYAATQEERGSLLGRRGAEEHLYKVHVPLDFQRIVAFARSYGALNVADYLRVAEQEGLCVRLGGGQMSGESMFSNRAPVPLALRNGSVVLVEEATRP